MGFIEDITRQLEDAEVKQSPFNFANHTPYAEDFWISLHNISFTGKAMPRYWYQEQFFNLSQAQKDRISEVIKEINKLHSAAVGSLHRFVLSKFFSDAEVSECESDPDFLKRKLDQPGEFVKLKQTFLDVAADNLAARSLKRTTEQELTDTEIASLLEGEGPFLIGELGGGQGFTANRLALTLDKKFSPESFRINNYDLPYGYRLPKEKMHGNVTHHDLNLADPEKIPFEGQHDALKLFNVLLHMRLPEHVETVLDKAHKMLAENGHLFIGMNHWVMDFQKQGDRLIFKKSQNYDHNVHRWIEKGPRK